MTISNAPANFTLNLNGDDFDSHNLTVSAAGGSGAQLQIDFSLDAFGAGPEIGQVTLNGYPTVKLNPVVSGSGVIIEDFSAVGCATLDVSGTGELDLGVGSSYSFSDNQSATVLLAPNATINDPNTTLVLGVTNAAEIDADLLLMLAPDNNTNGIIVDVVGNSVGNLLQGSLGPLTSIAGVGFTGVSGNDNITAGPNGGDNIYGDGGADLINLPATHSTPDNVFFGEFILGENAVGANNVNILAITNGSDVAFQGFWGATGTTATTIPGLITNLSRALQS